MAPTPDWTLLLWSCVLIQMLAAARRFDRPTWIRSYTSAIAYHGWRMLYIASQVILYLLVTSAAALLVDLGWTTDGSADWSIHVPMVTLVLAGWVIPAIPVLRNLERWPRRALHRLAGVPATAQNLAERLANARFVPPPEVERQVNSVMERRGVDPEAITIEPVASMMTLWMRAAMIFEQVRAWDESPRFRRFVESDPERFNDIRRCHDQLSLQISRALNVVGRSGEALTEIADAEITEGAAEPPSAAGNAIEVLKTQLRAALHELITGLREEAGSFHRSLCLYVARGILSTQEAAGSRVQQLRDLGFQIERRGRESLSVFGFVFVVWVGLLCLYFATQTSAAPQKSGPARAVMIGTIQVLAVVSAVYPKTRWALANVDLAGRAPSAFILGAGLFAFVACAPVTLLFKVFIFGGLEPALADVAQSYPWFLTAFSTAATTAYLIQDNRWQSTASATRRRLLDGVSMATTLCLAVAVVRVWLGWIGVQEIPEPRVIGLATTIGLVIGLVVPSAFRGSLRPRRGRPWSTAPATTLGA